ncbi:MAG: histidine phosphatase family protein [Gammaproteobacteria bacterium]|nr:histidine phosphatase family protein [Gammaproteobacteria bacterium]
MKTIFYIIRHGETEWNTVRRLQGELDSPLTSNGLVQAQLAAERLAKFDLNHIVSSPVGRALKTATLISEKLNLNLSTDKELRERHFGNWQGCYFDSLKDEPHFNAIFEQLTDHCPPNGESAVGCVNRVKNTIIKLASEFSGKRIGLVTHGDVIRTLLLDLGQNAKIDAYSRVGNGSVFGLSFDTKTLKFQVKAIPD